MTAWVVWLFAAVVLGVVETFTLTAIAGLLGGAALVTAGAGALGLAIPGQLLVFAVVAGVAIVVVRPIAARLTRGSRLERFGVDALAGRVAYVVIEVTDRTGTVRIGGEEWTARSLDNQLVIETGTAVDVIAIEGATAVVYPRE
jgi:membrane protein implicated in regulation of membrane protease activity